MLSLFILLKGYLKVNELFHHGIKGQKWGVRRFQNKESPLIEEGKKAAKKFNKSVERNRVLADTFTNFSERGKAVLAVATAGVGIAHKTGIDKMVANFAKTKVSDIRNSAVTAKGKRWAKNVQFVVRD